MPGPLPASPCRECGAKLDAATAIRSTAPPHPGDISVCLYCATVSIFTQDLDRRALTAAEVLAIERDPSIRRNLARMVAAVRAQIRRRN